MDDSGTPVRFDLPDGAVVGSLTGPATGVHRLVARPVIESTITLIDTPDHRLLRWGIELGRVVQTGQWLLRAEGWEPMLPAEQISEAAEDELPAGFASMIVPFRQGGVLGPALTVTGRRQPFHLIDDRQGVLGELSDERFDVRARDGGVTSWRTVTLSASGLDAAQVAALRAVLAAGGAVEVPRFPRVAARTGLMVRAGRRGLSVDTPIEQFVRAQLAARLRSLLQADLTVRAGQADGDAGVREGLAVLRNELSGLCPMLDRGWGERTLANVDAALADRSRSVVNADRYLRVLQALAQAIEEPPLDQVAGRRAGPVLAQELEALVQSVHDLCRLLDTHSTDARWAKALEVAEQASALTAQSADVFGRPARAMGRRLAAVVEALRASVRPDSTGLTRSLHGLTSAEIFDAGRAYERALLSVEFARQRFTEEWPELWRRLHQRLIRP